MTKFSGLDFEGTILYVNEAACRKTGYSREELNGMKIFMLDPDYSPEVWEQSVTDLRNRKIQYITTRHRCKDGTLIDVEVMTHYVKKGDKEFSFAFVHDISERKRAEETIASSREYLDQIFLAVKAGIVIIDCESHTIIDINPAGASLIGLPKDEIIGNSCHKFICPAETGQCPITDLHKDLDNLERFLVNRDGEKIPVIKYVTRMNLGGRDCLLETFIDNSDRRLAEDALRESEERYHELADFLPQIVFETDQDLKVTYANRHARNLFELTDADLKAGIPVFSFIDPSQHGEITDSVQKITRGISFEPKEYAALRRDGSTFPVIIYSSRFIGIKNFPGPGDCYRYLCTEKDGR